MAPVSLQGNYQGGAKPEQDGDTMKRWCLGFRNNHRRGGGTSEGQVTIGDVVSTWEGPYPALPSKNPVFRGLLGSLNRASAGHLGWCPVTQALRRLPSANLPRLRTSSHHRMDFPGPNIVSDLESK